MSVRKGNRAVVGAFAGDEGKGATVDIESADAEWVARYEGGANAGHTIQVGTFRFIGHLMPSGAAAGRKCALTKGVRVDPFQLFSEVDEFARLGGNLVQLMVAYDAFLSFDWHKAIEFWSERAKGSRLAYTTSRGMCGIAATIGQRLNVQVGTLFRPDELFAWLQDFYRAWQPIFEHREMREHMERLFADKEVEFDHVPTPREMADRLLSISDRMREYTGNVRPVLYKAWKEGAPILWEGAQGLMLDPYWGTWGYNTSGICTFAGVSVGTGLPVDAIGHRIGIDKAIATRVGNGPFPTELGDYAITDKEEKIPEGEKPAWLVAMLGRINSGLVGDQETGQYLRVKGDEYGATSGRSRRTGWFDCAWLAYFVQVNGPHEVVLTKLDCLSGLRRLKLCIGYKLDGEILPVGEIPPMSSDYARVEPVYMELAGWEENISGMTDYDSLPTNAKLYVEAIERFGHCKITRIGTGPDRANMIFREAA